MMHTLNADNGYFWEAMRRKRDRNFNFISNVLYIKLSGEHMDNHFIAVNTFKILLHNIFHNKQFKKMF